MLFGFQVKPTNNFLGTDGSGDAIFIYEDGLIEYNHFIFCSDTPVSSVKVRKGNAIVEDFKKRLQNTGRILNVFLLILKMALLMAHGIFSRSAIKRLPLIIHPVTKKEM